jgi:hypothetical protein
VGSTGNYSTIFEAFQEAEDGDTLSLDAETFSGENNYNIDLTSKSISIEGVDSSMTIIDCQSQGRAFFVQEFNTSFQSLSFSGITFRNCIAKTPSIVSAPSRYGGALFFKRSSLNITIQDCYFFNNSALQLPEDTLARIPRGGAIYATNANTPPGQGLYMTIERCTFESNTALNLLVQGSGGAIGFDGDDIRVQNSTFLSNYAPNRGGAMTVIGLYFSKLFLFGFDFSLEISFIIFRWHHLYRSWSLYFESSSRRRSSGSWSTCFDL